MNLCNLYFKKGLEIMCCLLAYSYIHFNFTERQHRNLNAHTVDSIFTSRFNVYRLNYRVFAVIIAYIWLHELGH